MKVPIIMSTQMDNGELHLDKRHRRRMGVGSRRKEEFRFRHWKFKIPVSRFQIDVWTICSKGNLDYTSWCGCCHLKQDNGASCPPSQGKSPTRSNCRERPWGIEYFQEKDRSRSLLRALVDVFVYGWWLGWAAGRELKQAFARWSDITREESLCFSVQPSFSFSDVAFPNLFSASSLPTHHLFPSDEDDCFK